jgi:hypothetical protein
MTSPKRLAGDLRGVMSPATVITRNVQQLGQPLDLGASLVALTLNLADESHVPVMRQHATRLRNQVVSGVRSLGVVRPNNVRRLDNAIGLERPEPDRVVGLL